jgi:hypothetical protein
MGQVLSRPFDLEIKVDSSDGITLRVLDSPPGPPREPVTVRIPSMDSEVQELLKVTGQPKVSVTKLRDLGSKLNSWLLPEPIGGLFRSRLHDADPQRPLRMRLMLGSELLFSVPWELAYDDDQNSFLAVDQRVTVVRVIRTTAPVRQRDMGRDMGVLMSLSQDPSSIDYETLSLVKQLSAELERLPNLRVHFMNAPATIPALIEMLRGSVNVLHLYTHTTKEHRRSIITVAHGQITTIESKTLAGVLRGSNVPLAILAASDPADKSRSGDEACVLLEFAAQLVAAGTPAVLAVPTALHERAGQLFWREFYRGIIQEGQSLDVALSAGRFALWQRREDALGWYMPALFAAPEEYALWPFGQYSPAVSAQQR